MKVQKQHLNAIRDVTSNWTTIPNSRNTSGVRGVSFNKRKDKLQDYISVRGKQICLGHYDTLKEVHTVRKMAEKHYWNLY